MSDQILKTYRTYRSDDTIVAVGDATVGGGDFMLIAGPCSVESAQQIAVTADAVVAGGTHILRGGAFKPRTSPYDFQGLQEEGIELLVAAGATVGLPVVSEITDAQQLPFFADVDIVQVGARNMQNFSLLRVLGQTNKPVLLKRGFGNTINELLSSAEYLMDGGNEQIILCERGIRSFDPQARIALDLSAIPRIKELSHLPVIVDPSHATGDVRFVRPMALAATAAGADGLMIEVHNNPENALCDGQQSIDPEAFAALAKDVTRLREVLY
ncbi:MAG: 3-deoxy-7-phosphoheptulonate synthase [Coriobacteriia bacterium]|nr:3-deoxy-7-phosphoheptulonate synthase [Coriobacteriia bacterium]